MKKEIDECSIVSELNGGKTPRRQFISEKNESILSIVTQNAGDVSHLLKSPQPVGSHMRRFLWYIGPAYMTEVIERVPRRGWQ
jgi:hypothetical protein